MCCRSSRQSLRKMALHTYVHVLQILNASALHRNVRSLKTAAICLFIFFMCISPRPLQTQSRCKHQTKDTCNRCLRLARSLRAIPARVAPIQAENLRRSNCKALSCIDTYARPERARLEELILHSAALHIT